MSSAQLLAAVSAVAAMDAELAEDRLTRNLGLELLVEMVLHDIAAAIGTALGQGSFVGFIDLAGRRWRAMAMLAVLVALFASWFFRLFLGFTFGERRRLSFDGALDRFETFLEIAIDLLESVDA